MSFAVISGILFVVGLIGFYWCNKRTFHRRNEVGVEEFYSYGHLVAARLGEGLVAICSAACLAASAIFLCKAYNFTPFGIDLYAEVTRMLSK